MGAGSGRRVLGYVRVSTVDQAESGLGLEAQRAAIEADCARRGWHLVDIEGDEGATGKTLDREGLHRALERIAAGEADGLVVAKLDRVPRSVVDFGTLLQWFERAGADFVALDLGVDTSTPAGGLVANVLAAVAQWEAATISARTRGEAISRAAVADDLDLTRRVRQLRANGATLRAIADELNADGVPTLRGGSAWRPSSVQAVLGYRRPSGSGSRRGLPKPTRRQRAA